MHIDVEELDVDYSHGIPVDEIRCCVIFEIMPKKFIEGVDKLIYNNE